MSNTYIYKIIDESYFFQRMSEKDLYVRNSNDIKSYINKYKKSINSFTFTEKYKIYTLIYKINFILKPYKKLSKIKWKFAKTDIESGYPHTLGDVIILPNLDNISIETLIHEKIHIYQRLYPTETSKLIYDIWGFYPKKRIEDELLARNNPDVDSFLYTIDIIKDKYISQIYLPGANQIGHANTMLMPDMIEIKPEALGLDKSIRQFEHPNEIMAELIASILVHGNTHIYDKKVIDWINKYL